MGKGNGVGGLVGGIWVFKVERKWCIWWVVMVWCSTEKGSGVDMGMGWGSGWYNGSFI